jgi:hypothetical protein
MIVFLSIAGNRQILWLNDIYILNIFMFKATKVMIDLFNYKDVLQKENIFATICTVIFLVKHF